jgi:hypothetical protein
VIEEKVTKMRRQRDHSCPRHKSIDEDTYFYTELGAEKRTELHKTFLTTLSYYFHYSTFFFPSQLIHFPVASNRGLQSSQTISPQTQTNAQLKHKLFLQPSHTLQSGQMNSSHSSHTEAQSEQTFVAHTTQVQINPSSQLFAYHLKHLTHLGTSQQER